MRRKAFTLVELLVVVGIIAILIAILMPALSRARDHANRIKCMSNLRNVMTGIVAYAASNKSAMPHPNWGGNRPGWPGWLYDNPSWPSWPLFPMEADGPNWQYLESGAVYRFVQNRDIFKCPLHTDRQSNGPTEKFTSYLMNGAVNDFGGHPQLNPPGNPWPISKFKVTDIIIWETGESTLTGNMFGFPPFNDGSSEASEMLSERHGARGRSTQTGKVQGFGGASVGCVDGHVEWFSYAEYRFEQEKPVMRRGESRLWISPSHPNGGWRTPRGG